MKKDHSLFIRKAPYTLTLKFTWHGILKSQRYKVCNTQVHMGFVIKNYKGSNGWEHKKNKWNYISCKVSRYS